MVTTDGKALGDVMLAGCRCRCGHEWIPRNKTDPPAACPKCKSANWDKPKGMLTKGK